MELSAPIKFNDIVTDKNINEAYRIIRKNTIHRKKLTVFEMYYLSNIFNIKNNLYNNTYTHQSYNIFLVQEPKYRIIMSEKLYDKIKSYNIPIIGINRKYINKSLNELEKIIDKM